MSTSCAKKRKVSEIPPHPPRGRLFLILLKLKTTEYATNISVVLGKEEIEETNEKSKILVKL